MEDKRDSAYSVIVKEGIGRCAIAARDLKVRVTTDMRHGLKGGVKIK